MLRKRHVARSAISQRHYSHSQRRHRGLRQHGRSRRLGWLRKAGSHEPCSSCPSSRRFVPRVRRELNLRRFHCDSSHRSQTRPL